MLRVINMFLSNVEQNMNISVVCNHIFVTYLTLYYELLISYGFIKS